MNFAEGPVLDCGRQPAEAPAPRRPGRQILGRLGRDDLSYAYFVGEIRILETRLLGRGQLLRMAEARDAETVFRMLAETEYARSIGAAQGPADYEAALAAELGQVFEIFRRDCPEPALVDLLGVAYTFQNLKAVLKAALIGKEADPRHLVAAGEVPGPALLDLIGGRGAGPLPALYAGPVTRVRELFEVTRDPQDVDLLLDAARLEAVLGRARGWDYRLLAEVTAAAADLVNMRTAVRLRLLGEGADGMRRAFLPGGEVPLERLERAMGGRPEDIPSELDGLPHSDVLAAGMRSYAATGSLARLEKLIDDRLLSLTGGARYVALGPDPVIAYFLAKETEIKNLRIIFTGKLNRLPEATISERLRETHA